MGILVDLGILPHSPLLLSFFFLNYCSSLASNHPLSHPPSPTPPLHITWLPLLLILLLPLLHLLFLFILLRFLLILLILHFLLLHLFLLHSVTSPISYFRWSVGSPVDTVILIRAIKSFIVLTRHIDLPWAHPPTYNRTRLPGTPFLVVAESLRGASWR